jgi:hypothetical protein
MESELKAVCEFILWNQEVNNSVTNHIEAFHDPQLTLKNDSETGPTFQAGMCAGPKLEVVRKTPKII